MNHQILYVATIFVVFCITQTTFGIVDWSEDTNPKKWTTDAWENINKILSRKENTNIAKNVVIFLGDGMGLPTVTAGRIYKGQLKGKNGEEEITNMEKFNYVALSKTYGVDSQTIDSAGSATAYLSGVKTRIGVIGLDGRALNKKCDQNLSAYKVDSILDWAHAVGKSVGIVTTTRITHATPAGTYAHTPYRDYESLDGVEFTEKLQSQGCKDIAAQLIEENSFIDLIFAGGRKMFLQRCDQDPQDPTLFGDRIDKRNLIDEWTNKMIKNNLRYKYLWNKTDFQNLKSNQYDRILGLFSHNHMQFEIDRVKTDVEPSIVEMTQKAIEILSQNPNGYFLLVEGGRIDMAHHESNAKRALADFNVFDEAIGKADLMTSADDTLIVVTADHSHMFSMGGYALRGNPILGVVKSVNYENYSETGLTFTALGYANGPGALKKIRKTNLTNEMTESDDFKQESAVLLESETHGGEDVAIYARGPMAHLFDGTVQQSYIPHAMAYSACIGPYSKENTPECLKRTPSGSLTTQSGSITTQSSSKSTESSTKTTQSSSKSTESSTKITQTSSNTQPSSSLSSKSSTSSQSSSKIPSSSSSNSMSSSSSNSGYTMGNWGIAGGSSLASGSNNIFNLIDCIISILHKLFPKNLGSSSR